MKAFHEKLRISNDPTCLVAIRDVVARGVEQGSFPPHYVNRLQIAVDEAVTNIIEHGYQDHPRGEAEIDLQVDVNADYFRVEITDQGAHFDPRSVRDVDIERHVRDGRGGGLGVFLMRRIMDVVDYQYETGRHNRLVLVKNR